VILDTVVKESLIIETGANPLRRCQEILSGRKFQRLVVTGYGRHLVAPAQGGEIVSEIKAFAVGAKYLLPDCQGVIDIGGQDCKVILLSPKGDVRKFEMNDRCAAGTGKFLEVMAHTLEVDIGALGDLALSANRKIIINSLCTVFAESEAVSLISRGEQAGDIVLALHEAIATRVATMAKRVGIKGKIIFAGGASLNRCMGSLLGEKLGMELIVPEVPQLVGALGAVLLASLEREKRERY
jgi:predicted CoA-substrate-specific enzyme activase